MNLLKVTLYLAFGWRGGQAVFLQFISDFSSIEGIKKQISEEQIFEMVVLKKQEGNSQS